MLDRRGIGMVYMGEGERGFVRGARIIVILYANYSDLRDVQVIRGHMNDEGGRGSSSADMTG